ncbi:MAG: cell envelope integrity protein TolA [Rubrivivax sp.]
MNAAVEPSELLRPRPAEGLGRGAALAVVVHLGLVIALAFSVHWRRQPVTTFNAEIWSALPEQAAPKAVLAPPPPPPPPTPRAEPRPTPTPPPRADADIALEQAKRRAAEREQVREQDKQREQERKAQREREAQAVAKRQREAEAATLKQQRELQDKRRAELERKAEEARREEARQEEARREAALAQQREANLKRMLGQAGVTGATGGADSTGSAARDSGPSPSYGGKIIARVKPNIVLTDSVPPSLEAVVEVRASATGTVLARRIVKSSGNAIWDEAVLRAIDRTGTLPRDTDGRVPSPIIISFTPG